MYKKRWRRGLLSGALMIIAILCSGTAVSAADSMSSPLDGSAGYASDRILVVFAEGVSPAKAESVLEENSFDGRASQEIYEGITSVELPGDMTVEKAINSLKQNKEVDWVQPDYIYECDGFTNDLEISSGKYSSSKDKYHYLFKMGLAGPGKTAWSYANGKGVNVAVVDGGSNVYHNDLKANVKGTYNAVTRKEGLANVTNKKTGHGSVTAGILAAVGNNKTASAGVAYAANLYVVKVEDEEGYMYTSDILEGIRWASDDKKCRVISLSLGSDYDTAPEAMDARNAEKEIIQRIYNKAENSTLVVASGGNAGKYIYHYPASWPEAISVSALTYSSSKGYTISAKSTYNNQIDLAAPGSGLYGVSNTSNTALLKGGATSAAAPYVAGVAALVFQVNPDLTAKECAAILTSTARDAGKKGYDTHYGYGIIDPLAAVKKAALTVTPKKASLSKVQAGKKSLKAVWKRDKSATGYQVVVAKDKNFKQGKKTATIKNNKTTQKTFKKLSRNKVYYVKLRSYKTMGETKIYGNYSNVKKVLVK